MMELYLEGTEPNEDQLMAAIRRGHHRQRRDPRPVRQRVQEQGRPADADAIVDYLPSPVDIAGVAGHKVGDESAAIERHADPSEPFAALAFKIMSDQHLGKLTYIRIYSGTLETGTAVLNSTKDRKERIGKIYQMHANKREERPTAVAGQIVAVMGLKDTSTGDTLSDQSNQVILESMTFPAPVINVAIEPRTKADQDKLGTAIRRLAEEDPTFQVRTDEETGQTIIAGMGELHLEVLVERMKREFRVEANIGRPQVAYRETVTKKVEKVDYTHRKQTGGAGQYGRVVINLEPTGGDGGGYEFENKITGGRIPREYIPSVDAGCQEAAEFGVLAGYPMVDLKVTLTGRRLPRGGLLRARLQDRRVDGLQEGRRPGRSRAAGAVMAVEVRTPDEYMGGRHRRPEQPPGPDPGDGGAVRDPGRQGTRAAVGDVRLRRGPAQPDPGPGGLHHAVRLVRRSPAEHFQGDHRESPRRVAAVHTSGARAPAGSQPHLGGEDRKRRNQWRRPSSSGPSRT
jgi:elongation factor G